jgi:ribosomal protein S18 acetylase RimI-like enzyme
MGQEQIVIRPARPTEDDGMAFGRLIHEVTEGALRFLLGRRVVEILCSAFREPDHDLSFQNTLFAQSDESVVGMVVGYPAGPNRRSSYRPLMAAEGSRLRRRIGIALFHARWRMMGHPFSGEFYVEYLIVDKAFRSQGIGTMLMGAVEKRAREIGSPRLTLDLAAKNDGGRRFYERLGMRQVPDWPPGRISRRVVHRLSKPLG